jgi:hypothetical protein
MTQGGNGRGAYPPLDTLKPVADEVWIVDGPEIGYGVGPLELPFPTRMTIVRLSGRRLFVHSPTRLTAELRHCLHALGEVAFIVAPNRIHYWWVPDFRFAFPQAEVWLAPRVREQAKGRIDFRARELSGTDGYPWDEEMRTLPVAGDFMTEVEFFHVASRTLILTDFIENFEAEKLGWLPRLFARLGGVTAPEGSMPRDMRFSYRRQKPQLAAAVRQMIDWNPERVLIAHGRWFPADGAAELSRAFAWLLRGEAAP